MNLVNEVEKKQINLDSLNFNIGDTITVYSKITEGKKERIQMFSGLCIKITKPNSLMCSIVVRKRTDGIGIEKTFRINSPLVKKIEVIRHGKVRRAKLYYMRDLIGKAEKPKLKKKTK